MAFNTESRGAAIRRFKADLETTLADMAGFAGNTLSDTQISETRAILHEIVDRECHPDNHLSYIDSGHFKEVYALPIGGWVVKFCAEDDRLEDEMSTHRKAAEFGIGEVFLPFWMLELPYAIGAAHVSRDSDDCYYDEENHCWTDDQEWRPDLDRIVFQPECYVVANSGYHVRPRNGDEYAHNPIVSKAGEIVPYTTILDLDICAHCWVQRFIDVYGDDKFNLFCKFIDIEAISDLHGKNLGYFEKGGVAYPVILDWFSYDSE